MSAYAVQRALMSPGHAGSAAPRSQAATAATSLDLRKASEKKLSEILLTTPCIHQADAVTDEIARRERWSAEDWAPYHKKRAELHRLGDYDNCVCKRDGGRFAKMEG